MNPPDVTNAKNEWVLMVGRNDLWANTIFDGVYSTDGGKTFTIASERESPEKPRQVRDSRKV